MIHTESLSVGCCNPDGKIFVSEGMNNSDAKKLYASLKSIDRDIRKLKVH